jgi:hypothetical protein
MLIARWAADHCRDMRARSLFHPRCWIQAWCASRPCRSGPRRKPRRRAHHRLHTARHTRSARVACGRSLGHRPSFGALGPSLSVSSSSRSTGRPWPHQISYPSSSSTCAVPAEDHAVLVAQVARRSRSAPPGLVLSDRDDPHPVCVRNVVGCPVELYAAITLLSPQRDLIHRRPNNPGLFQAPCAGGVHVQNGDDRPERIVDLVGPVGLVFSRNPASRAAIEA